jgi:hypothetical protein
MILAMQLSRRSACPILLFMLGLGCDPSSPNMICGPGTHREGHICVADETDDPTADTSVPEDSGGDPEDTGEEPLAAVWDVYLLAGQSNMEGVGQVSALPPSLRVAQDDVWIYWSGVPEWRGLQPSSGYSSGWGEVFGPEVLFGRTLADADPDTQVALIKHSVGGTDLAQFWYPGESSADLSSMGEGYQVFLETVLEGLAELEDAGQKYRIAGMIWMQGESDACYEGYSADYEANMTHFIERVRDDVGAPEMPFVMGLIDCMGLCPYRSTVRDAQVAVAVDSETVQVIETEDLGMYPEDGWHYQGLGMRVLGTRFAEALLGEELSDLPTAAIRLTGTYSAYYTGYYTVGWSFEVSERLRVTDLGIFDYGDDGLNYSATVGIWDADTSSLLLAEEVPSVLQQGTSYVGGFRTVGIEPHVLEPGRYIIGNTTVSGDPNYYVYDAGYQGSENVSWISGMHAEGSVLELPIYSSEGTDTVGLWFGPNFLYYSE